MGSFAYIFSVLNITWKSTSCCTYYFINLISVQLTDCSLNVACESDVRGSY